MIHQNFVHTMDYYIIIFDFLLQLWSIQVLLTIFITRAVKFNLQLSQKTFLTTMDSAVKKKLATDNAVFQAKQLLLIINTFTNQ